MLSTRKEAYRLFWLVKGHIEISDQQAFDSASGYFRRLWFDGSNGAPISDYEIGFEEAWRIKMSKFIAAMDHSGGSTGGVLERYEQEYTEEDKMEKVHAMRLRMVSNPDFNSDNIWAAILYKDTIERGMVPILKEKHIKAILKVDSGCNEDGTLKDFNLDAMITYAQIHECYGTKMRSIINDESMIIPIVKQQFIIAKKIASTGLVPIIEPEIPINHPNKAELEGSLLEYLKTNLNSSDMKCILKLTLPEVPDFYSDLETPLVKLVGLSGGYTTEEACKRLTLNTNMTASFSRALSEGLYADQYDDLFNGVLSENINNIVKASEVH